MSWSYEYPSKQAIHLPTKLEFSVTYDPVNSDRKIKLNSERPAYMTDAQLSGLVQELQVQIQDRYLQSKMSQLLHFDYDGDYDRAALILAQQTKKRVSTRTLQAWMMPPGRPSSRRCPEWAVAALELYLHQNPDAPLWWKDVANVSRSTEVGRKLERTKQLRERETLRIAEQRIADEQAIRAKWQECAVADIPTQLASFEIATQARLERHFDLIHNILTSVRTCESLEELKQELETEVAKTFQLDRMVKETASDIREGKNEFAADDGTLPRDSN
ncbi:MAG: hypothetical protein M3Q42_04700 [Pseudomonadota bacterium]|nr:hypothetical protein [Pseudomonadota bacterium]